MPHLHAWNPLISIVATFAVLGCATTQKKRTPTPPAVPTTASTASTLESRLNESGEQCEVQQIDDSKLEIQCNDGQHHIAPLKNDGTDVERLLAFVKSEGKINRSVIESKVGPAVLTTSFLKQRNAHLISTPIAGEIVLAYGWRSDQAQHYLTQQDADRAGLSIQEMSELAQRNFLKHYREFYALLKTTETRIEGSDASIYAVIGPNAPSLLVMREDWRIRSESFKGPPVVRWVHVDALLYADSGVPEALAQLKRMGDELKAGAPVRFVDDRWEAWNY